MNTTNNVHIFLAIVLSVQIANCCDLCFKFSGHTGIAYCTHSTRCVKVLNGYADKRLREVRVRNCNVTVVLSPDLLNIDIKDRTGKRCYGKYFFSWMYEQCSISLCCNAAQRRWKEACCQRIHQCICHESSI